MTYIYQRSSRYFAQVAEDIKDLAEAELTLLGADRIHQAYRGLHFDADRQTLYRINYESRLINRVLAPLIKFNCHSDKYLYKTAMELQWDDFFDPSQTFAVFASVSHSFLKHSKFASLRLKDAIVDYFKAKTGQRPNVDTRNPDVWFNLHIEHNEATISLDTSGGSLHRRGYRHKSLGAPMSETVAATIIKLSEWQGEKPLVDPFCGSGTLLCEAFLTATQTPAAILRKQFGFERLPDFDHRIWKSVKRQSESRIASIQSGLINGSDISAAAIQSAQKNCLILDKDKRIGLKQQDVYKIKHIEGKIIVCNPPYGIRLKQNMDLSGFYKRFGDFLKQRCKDSTAYIYFGERSLIKSLGLKTSWKKPLSSGGLDGRLVKVDLY